MHKRMAITLDEAVYDGLIRLVGRGKVSQFLEGLARPYVTQENLVNAYRAMALDTEREQAALEWVNGLAGDGVQ